MFLSCLLLFCGVVIKFLTSVIMMRSMLPFVLSKGVWLQIASATRQFSMSKAVLENAKSSYTRTTQENGIRNIVLNDPKTR